MSQRIADEREQRRGLILGLTLAEMLLLLLFLLLLALAAQLRQAQARVAEAVASLEQIKPLQEALMSGGAVDIISVHELVLRFQRLTEVEKELGTVKEQNALLTQQSELLKTTGIDTPEKMRALSDAMQRASQISPNDPPAFLKRAVEVMDKLGPNTTPEQLTPLTQMASQGDLAQRLATAEAEREKLRTDVLNLMHKSGNGLTYPSCWKTPTGQTEYMFDIIFGDAGIRVKDATPDRANDQAWQMVGVFTRNAEINERTFVAATKKLANWANTQNCKFYTINRDETGASNKARYKLLQRTIEQNFYPYYPPTANAATRPRTQTGGPTASGQTQDQPQSE